MSDLARRFPKPDIDRISQAIKGLFPIKAKNRELDIVDVTQTTDVTPDDTLKQLGAKLSGRTFGNRLQASMVMKEDGKVIDRDKVNILTVPELTNFLTYVVSGNDYQVPLQLRLKQNVFFEEESKTGERRARFNVRKGRGFSVKMDPASRQMYIDVGPKIGVYPVLRLLGVGDDRIKAELGEEIFKAISKVDSEKELGKATKAFLFGEKYSPEKLEELKKHFTENTIVGPAIKDKLGVKDETVTGDVLLKATRGLLDVYRGKREIDDVRDLKNNSVFGIDDFLVERIALPKFASNYKNRIARRMMSRDKIKSVVTPLSDQVLSFFKHDDDAGIVQYAQQTNPVTALSGASRVVMTGAGAIRDPNQITLDVRNVHPSTFGYIDPVSTPDNFKVGVSLQLTAGATKKGNQLVSNFYDVNKKRRVELAPEDLKGKTISTHDEFTSGKKNMISFKDGKVVRSAKKEIDYLVTPVQTFSFGSLLSPFMSSDQGNRLLMANKMVSQALPLKEAETPLVLSKIPETDAPMNAIIGAGVGHSSPVDGRVTSIRKNRLGYTVNIRGTDGKKHAVSFAAEYPFNDNTYMTESPIVKKGDSVKANQVISETNFTRGGKSLTLGRNLRVAYMPYLSATYDDAIAISESAAQKLTSQHMYQYEVDDNTLLGKRKFLTIAPGSYKKDDIQHLNEQGLPAVGSEIKPGQPIYLALSRAMEDEARKKLAAIDKRFAKPYRDHSLKWEQPVTGKVVNIVQRGNKKVIYVKSDEPARVGDKLVGGHGNKGIIAEIIPDDSMIRTEDGRPVDILMNPIGITSRMNVGQVWEAIAGKVAEKTGKPVEVEQFGKDNYEFVRQLMEKHGVSDKEIVVDPVTNKKINSFVGNTHIYKLNHPVMKKFSVRQREGYSVDQQPIRVTGSNKSAKSEDAMAVYALMAHGADNFLEDSVRRSSNDPAFWAAYESGMPLPPPKPSYVNQQLMSYLKAAGVNVDASRDRIKFSPMLDKDVKAIAAGTIKHPLGIRAKDLAPEAGGLFDEGVTGGIHGQKWASIELQEPIVHPLYEDFVNSVVSSLGHDPRKMTGSEIRDVLAKHKPADVLKLVQDKNRKQAEPKAITMKSAKALRAAIRSKTPLEDFVITKVPVLPPMFRPVYPLPDGSIEESPINKAYKNLLLVNNIDKQYMTAEERRAYHDKLKDAVGIVVGLHDIEDGDFRAGRGAISVIKGTRNKYGLFQSKLMSRRMDYSASAVATPDHNFGINEIGMPEDMAWGLYAPHVTRDLSRRGFLPAAAKKEVEGRTTTARRTLEKVMSDTPVVVNRAPSLHKFSMLAFYPKMVKGNSLRTNPLINEGYNLDHDGDSIVCRLLVRDLDGNVSYPFIKKLKDKNKIISHKRITEYPVKPVDVLDDNYQFVSPSVFTEHKLDSVYFAHTFSGRVMGLSGDYSLIAADDHMSEDRFNASVGRAFKLAVNWPARACKISVTPEEAIKIGKEVAAGSERPEGITVPDSVIFGSHVVRFAFVSGLLRGAAREIFPRTEGVAYRLVVSDASLGIFDFALRSIGAIPVFRRMPRRGRMAVFNRDDVDLLMSLDIPKSIKYCIRRDAIEWRVAIPACVADALIKSGVKAVAGKTSATVNEIRDMIQDVDIPDKRFSAWVRELERAKHYDFIDDIIKKGPMTAYDITVDNKKFIAGCGFKVWDTMMLHVPITEAGKRDAKNMVPSLHLINPRTNDVINTIRNEGILTLYRLARADGKTTDIKFKSLSDAQKAYDAGKMSYNDSVIIGGKRTSIGQAWIRDALPPKYAGMKLPENKRGWDMFFRDLSESSASEYESTINKLSNMAFSKTLDTGFSIGLSDLKPIEKLERAARKLEDTRSSAVVGQLDNLRKAFDGEVVKSDSALAEMVRVGAKGGAANLRQMLGAPVQLQNIDDTPIPMFIGGNFSRGMRLSSYLASMPAVRKGVIDRALMTAEPGALAKQLVAGAFSSVITMDDCGTGRGLVITDPRDMVDRYTATRQFGYPKNTLITPQIAARLTGKNVRLRSPTTCEAPSGICAKCYGVHYGGKQPEVGDNVGVESAEALSEPATQMTMRCQSGHYVDAKGNWVAFADMSPADTVLDADCEVRALSWDKHEPHDRMLLVVTKNGFSHLCQANHPMWVADLRDASPGRQPSEIEMVQREVVASDLREYHAIQVSINDVTGTAQDPDVHGYIAGLYAGDGCRGTGNGTAEYTDMPIAARIAVLAGQSFGDRITGKMASIDPDCRVHDRVITKYPLEHAGQIRDLVRGSTPQKRLKPGFNKFSKRWLMDFLGGLIDSNGTVCVKWGITKARIFTTSYFLAQQIQYIGHVLKLRTNIFVHNPSGGIASFKNQPFTVGIRFTENASEWEAASVKLASVGVKTTKQNPYFPSSGYDRVVRISEVKLWSQDVYDIQTETSGFINGCLRAHNTFHTGGAGGKSIGAGFERLKSLLTLPQHIKSQAILSPVSGKIGRVTKDVSGGHYVNVGKIKVFIPPQLAVTVKSGDSVIRGDQLSTGNVNPYDVLEHQGWDKAVHRLRNDILDQYRGSGINIRSRPVETILRTMTGLYEVTDPGKSDYVRGELIPSRDIKDGAVARPTIKGIGSAILSGPADLFERLAFQRLEEAVRQAGLERRVAEPFRSPISNYVTEKDISKRREKLRKAGATPAVL